MVLHEETSGRMNFLEPWLPYGGAVGGHGRLDLGGGQRVLLRRGEARLLHLVRREEGRGRLHPLPLARMLGVAAGVGQHGVVDQLLARLGQQLQRHGLCGGGFVQRDPFVGQAEIISIIRFKCYGKEIYIKAMLIIFSLSLCPRRLAPISKVITI